ncbi:MAG: glycosyl hydrolase family 28-related protein, partial [Methanococcaceae archaeon]
MKKMYSYFLVLAAFLFLTGWSQISKSGLPLNFKSVWEKAGIPGGIPEIKSNIVNVVDKGAAADGVTDDYEIIQSAIDNAAVPGVIFFPSGVYRINGRLNLKSGIILRGKDPGSTRLEFDSQAGCIQAMGTNSDNYVKITSGSGFGSKKIVVSDASGFRVGDGGHIRQGMVHKVTLTWLENPRTVGQMVKITAIKGNTLTIEPALNFDYASNPPLDGQGVETSKVKYIENAGIENI